MAGLELTVFLTRQVQKEAQFQQGTPGDQRQDLTSMSLDILISVTTQYSLGGSARYYTLHKYMINMRRLI